VRVSTLAPVSTLVAVDTGGTFTDILALADGKLLALKTPSTPDDPARAIQEGIKALLGEGTPYILRHGTTVATNALLERKGARVGLLTNLNFEDVIEIGRQDRPQLYALVGHRKPPLVARKDRRGIEGRLDPSGDELTPLDPQELADLVQWAQDRDVIAVCLLHSYASSAHEEAVAAILEAEGINVSLSSRILPEFREYERTSTTVVNAYVAPLVSGYLARIEASEGAERVSIMGSNGGMLPVARARSEPVHTVLSGPAGGVVGAMDWARRSGFDNALTFDMGGTSTDVSVCPDGALRTREFTIDSHPVAIPVIDIHTVGAGGGSLARVDVGGILRVGPESAGATPGPICYGRGGTQVTVTDANVWLGRMPSDGFLGGANTLDRDAIEGPLQTLAMSLGMSMEAVAEGVIEVAESAMERALRVISMERGYDPRDFCLVAFGGAGGLHVAELAQRIGAPTAIVPPDPGLLSAYGILMAPVSRELSRTLLLEAGDSEPALTETLKDLSTEAHEALMTEGIHKDAVRIQRLVDARYQGQSFELRVPARDWVEAFHSAHEERYGYARRDSPVEVVTVRVIAEGPPSDVPGLTIGPMPDPATKTTTVLRNGVSEDATLVERTEMGRGFHLKGPAVIVEYSATTWIPEDWKACIDQAGSILLTRRDA